LIRTTECGGDFALGKRKSSRPFSKKAALHLVLKSETVISLLLPCHRKAIEEALLKLSKKWGITLYDKAINTNHLHLLIKAMSKITLSHFLRALSGIIAMKITGAKKGRPVKFWAKRVYSRIVSFGREFSRGSPNLILSITSKKHNKIQ